jgi:hypothetical protein
MEPNGESKGGTGKITVMEVLVQARSSILYDPVNLSP